jgi:hypothetical protein
MGIIRGSPVLQEAVIQSLRAEPLGSHLSKQQSFQAFGNKIVKQDLTLVMPFLPRCGSHNWSFREDSGVSKGVVSKESRYIHFIVLFLDLDYAKDSGNGRSLE